MRRPRQGFAEVPKLSVNEIKEFPNYFSQLGDMAVTMDAFIYAQLSGRTYPRTQKNQTVLPKDWELVTMWFIMKLLGIARQAYEAAQQRACNTPQTLDWNCARGSGAKPGHLDARNIR
jgi:hypothetical protein